MKIRGVRREVFMATDPVCGMEVEPERTAASSKCAGTTYYFCASACKERFDDDPGRYVPAGEGCEKKGLLERLFGG
jgi:YHS domain-containing protein